MFAAMFYVLRTGIPWRDLPERFGPWGSVYTRFRRWCARGLFARLLAAVAKCAKGELRYIDCSHIKLYQDGAYKLLIDHLGVVGTGRLISQP